jgi:hypothetical protein
MSALTPFPSKLRGFVLVLALAVVAVAVALGRLGPPPDLAALTLFVALVVLSEHRSVWLADGITVSASFMVGMAAVVVFGQHGELLGALVVGASGGLYFPQLRRSTWPWIPLNAALLGCAWLAAVAAYVALPDALTRSFPLAIVAGLIATLAYVAVNVSLVVASYAVEGITSFRETAQQFVAPSLQALPLALLGVTLGYLYLRVGAGVVLLMIVPVLVAREMFQGASDVRAANDDTLRVLIRALEAKDRYTAGHSERVAGYARYIGEELGLSPSRLERLRVAALCHDIGKLAVPNHLLNKPGKLTEAEFARVKLHEQVTTEILSHIDFLAPVAPDTSHEASRYDPDDESHPIEPYAIAVADAFDAMTSTRAYRRALPQDVALAELRDCAGRQFDPTCVEALVRALERRGERHGAGEAEDVVEHFDVAPPVRGVGSAGLGDLEPSIAEAGGDR